MLPPEGEYEFISREINKSRMAPKPVELRTVDLESVELVSVELGGVERGS